ncbi:hypothetical protein KAS08_03270 [Candidatus Pacearchaeota archaeon]|nr:hypothetical protein [Candidatus Pacearchaeota archaeon]
MNTNLKKLFSEKKSLEEKILHLEKKKRQLRTHHISLQQQLKNNKISTSKFHELLNEMLKNRSYEQWMIYFEEYHNYYKSLLKICNQKITKEKNSHKNKKIIITGLAAIFLIFALIFFATNPQFTGLAVDNITPETNTTKNITEIINITEEISTETKIVTPKTKISKEQITTTKSKIIINRPVKWIQKIKLNKSKNETLTLPKSSNNISILTAQEIEESLEELITYNEIVNTSSKEEIRTGILTGQVTTEVDKRKGILTKFWEWATEFTITGQVIQETDLEEIITETPQEKIIDLTKIKETEIAIEFYTEAPTSKETKTERGKKIQISAADELAYEEILTYTELDIKVPNDSIYLYHLANNTQTKVDFESFDLDSDGFIDYIEWTVPHLSTQTYEIIIITKAEHLDNNREFIKNIYEEAKELDDIWTPEINDGEYARVTFERDLDSTKDITIFPRITSGNPQIEIYELNQNELIAKFENINSNEYNKVLLTKLQGIQDVFDLKIIGGSIEFDHIIDPVTNLIATSCDLNDAANTACFDAISTDGSTNFAFTKNAHIDVPLQTLSNVETVNSATLYYDSSGMLSGTWSVYIKDSRDGTTLCSSDPAQEYETETRDSIDCSGITPTQLLNGVWLQIDNDDGAGPQDVTIDYAYLYVDYEEPTVNLAPTNPTPSINSTDGTNFTTQDLNCFSTISDPNSDNLNVTVQWYNNSNLFLTQNFNNNYPSETAFVAILDAGNTSENDIWKCGITLSDGLLNSSQINSSELTIEIQSDTTYPQFSSLTENPSDPATYSPSTTYEFNSTITNTNTTVYINLDEIDYTPIQNGDTYSKEFLSLPANVHNYSWISYGNGTEENVNQTIIQTYTINKATSSISLYLNNSESNITVEAGTQIYLNCSTIFGDSSSILKLEKHGLLINQGNSPIQNLTTFSTEGLENITCTYETSQNYSSISKTFWVNVTTPTVNLAPTNPTPSINSTDGTNFTTQDLNCFSTISDPNSDNLNVTVQWYNNSNLFLTQNFNNNYPSETAFVAILDAGNTSENDIWKCGITLSDGLLNSSQINSSELTIESSPGFSNLTVTSCDINNVANTPCFDAISTDEGTSFALGKGIHIDAPFQTLSDIPTINSATLYYDSSGTLSGTWNIYVRDSRDGTIICSVVSAPEDVTETRNSLDCSEITPTQLSNGIWLQIDNDDTAGPEDMTIDYVYLHVDYSEQNTPTISHIDTISPQSITEAGETPITFSFQVTDLDGTTDINDSTAYAKFQKTGETTRETLCTKTGNINETIANFSCTIDMWYFDGAGDWTINTSISDTTNRYAENSSTSFLLGQTTAMTFSPSSISFSGISSPADTNVLADQSILINNTGNDEISTGNVRVTATNLVGETVSSFAIYAENFTVHTAAACGVGTPMQNATEIGIVGATLTIGNFSLNDGSTGQEQLFYCLEVMNADLTAQTYSTTASGAWTITLLLAALRITKPKKKKKQSLYLEKPELLKNPEFLEFLESERIFEQFETKLTKENEIPATIFKSRNALEAICRYLKDEKDMKLSEIASALNRDPRTIWTSYHNADAEIFPPEVTDIKVPVSIFEKENLSILESISLYLKNNGMKNKEIAELLGKNSKTIWTFIDRAKKKSE